MVLVPRKCLRIRLTSNGVRTLVYIIRLVRTLSPVNHIGFYNPLDFNQFVSKSTGVKGNILDIVLSRARTHANILDIAVSRARTHVKGHVLGTVLSRARTRAKGHIFGYCFVCS